MAKNKGKKRHPKSRAVLVWAIVSVLLICAVAVGNVVARGQFSGLMDTAFGGQRPVYDTSVVSMYPAQNTSSKAEAFQNALDVNLRVAQEGMVLLKNDDKALPLQNGAKLSVFGKNSVNLSYGGSGSGGFDTSSNMELYESLERAGFTVNKTLKSFYENNTASGPARSANSSDLDSGSDQRIATAETPQSKYTDAVKASYDAYKDAALVVITRIGGEGFDLPRYQGSTEGAVSADSHYLQLDQNERDLLSAVCDAGFEHVVVVLNTPSSFEAAFLTDSAYAEFADRIDAALWIGFTGSNGIEALGQILNGTVNPSGRLVDTWAADFKANPSFINFGTGSTDGSTDQYDDGMYYSVDYEEGIYVGYRYYETRSLTDGEAWYAQNVVYPFGYGLSYTHFDWTVGEPSAETLDADSVISIPVTVKNTGDTAGKEVVELYVSAPYTQGGIEKAHKVLVGFAKTGVLKPGESETVHVTFTPYDAASYDYRDANGNGFCGYELEKGEYSLYVSRNAHEAVAEKKLMLAEDIRYETDPVTGSEVIDRYTDAEGTLDSDAQLDTVLSRTDWEGTWPTAQTAVTHAGLPELMAQIKDVQTNNPTDYDEEDAPWFDEAVVSVLRDLLPQTPAEDYKAIVDYDDERWEEILDACSEEDMLNLINYAAYHTMAIENIGLPATIHGDGPSGFTCFMNSAQVNGTCQYVSEPVMASTWNLALIQEVGAAMGEEGVQGDSTTGQPYSSIYAPGLNIHRSPFGGRCSEYFSEDAFISGMMGGAEVRGLQSRGVIPMIKHFAVNEQETHRSIGGDLSWLTEQSLREIYLKSFEITVKTGEARGLMSSFNRIGSRWTGGDYRLITQILREEWGFQGAVICDFNTIPQYMVPRQMFYAGGDLDLATLTTSMWTDADTSENGDAIVLRNAVKNVLYAMVNSNAMNAVVVSYRPPVWHEYLMMLNIGVGVLVVLWGILAFVRRSRYNKRMKTA